MHVIKNFEKIKRSVPESVKHLRIKGYMGGWCVCFSYFKDGLGVIDTELEEEFYKIESSPDVRVSYRNFSDVYSIHEDELKALGCTRLLSIFHKMIGEDFSDFLKMIDEDSLDVFPDYTFFL